MPLLLTLQRIFSRILFLVVDFGIGFRWVQHKPDYVGTPESDSKIDHKKQHCNNNNNYNRLQQQQQQEQGQEQEQSQVIEVKEASWTKTMKTQYFSRGSRGPGQWCSCSCSKYSACNLFLAAILARKGGSNISPIFGPPESIPQQSKKTTPTCKTFVHQATIAN